MKTRSLAIIGMGCVSAIIAAPAAATDLSAVPLLRSPNLFPPLLSERLGPASTLAAISALDGTQNMSLNAVLIIS